MKRSICGIGVVSMPMRVESFGRSVELSSERKKLPNWIKVIGFL